MVLAKVLQAERPWGAAGAVLWHLLRGLLVIALLALVAALAVAAVAPRLFGYPTLVVNGGSMGASVPNGSLVFARWLDAEDVAVGDVILVQLEGDDGPAAGKIHRVVSVDEEGGQVHVRTKGDANAAVDPDIYILPDRVITPAFTLPYLGHLVAFVVTPLGWAFLVVLPAGIATAIALRAIWSDGGKRTEETGSG